MSCSKGQPTDFHDATGLGGGNYGERAYLSHGATTACPLLMQESIAPSLHRIPCFSLQRPHMLPLQGLWELSLLLMRNQSSRILDAFLSATVFLMHFVIFRGPL